jgi:hypothetical protein
MFSKTACLSFDGLWPSFTFANSQKYLSIAPWKDITQCGPIFGLQIKHLFESFCASNHAQLNNLDAIALIHSHILKKYVFCGMRPWTWRNLISLALWLGNLAIMSVYLFVNSSLFPNWSFVFSFFRCLSFSLTEESIVPIWRRDGHRFSRHFWSSFWAQTKSKMSNNTCVTMRVHASGK